MACSIKRCINKINKRRDNMTSASQGVGLTEKKSCCSPRLINVARGVILSGTMLSNFVHGYFSISGYLTAVRANEIYSQFCSNNTTTGICRALASTVDSTPVKTLVWDLGTIGLNFAAGWALARLCDAGCWPSSRYGRPLTSLKGTYTIVPGDPQQDSY